MDVDKCSTGEKMSRIAESDDGDNCLKPTSSTIYIEIKKELLDDVDGSKEAGDVVGNITEIKAEPQQYVWIPTNLPPTTSNIINKPVTSFGNVVKEETEVEKKTSKSKTWLPASVVVMSRNTDVGLVRCHQCSHPAFFKGQMGLSIHAGRAHRNADVLPTSAPSTAISEVKIEPIEEADRHKAPGDISRTQRTVPTTKNGLALKIAPSSGDSIKYTLIYELPCAKDEDQLFKVKGEIETESEVKIEPIDEADRHKEPGDISWTQRTVPATEDELALKIAPNSGDSIKSTSIHEIPCTNIEEQLFKVKEEIVTGSDNIKSPLGSANDRLQEVKLKKTPVISLQQQFIGTCTYCSKEFNSETLLEKHVFNHVNDVKLSDQVTEERKFDCEKCDKKFLTRAGLTKHFKWHAEDKYFECDICKKKFRRKWVFIMHMRAHTGDKPHKCNVCGRCFIRKTYLNNHVRTHTGERPFECNICNKTFVLKNTLNKHLNTHTGDKPHKCDVCDKTFASYTYWTIHARIHTGKKPYQCNICSNNFNTKNALNHHVKSHAVDNPFTCNICDKEFTTKYSLFCHIRTHTGETPFRCGICDKRFSTKCSFIEHMEAHAEVNTKSVTGDENATENDITSIPVEVTIDTDKNKSIDSEVLPLVPTKDKSQVNSEKKDENETENKIYRCELCDQLFTVKEALINHSKKHTKEIKCEICYKIYPFVSQLKRHMTTHTGERPFPCSVCGKEFCAKNELNRHVKIHTGEKPFKCEICNKRFITKTILSNHIQTHSGKRPYKCDLCIRKFTLKSQLITHTSRCHPKYKLY